MSREAVTREAASRHPFRAAVAATALFATSLPPLGHALAADAQGPSSSARLADATPPLRSVVVLPTAIVEGPARRAPVPGSALGGHARALDVVLGDTAQDLGLRVDVSDALRRSKKRLPEAELVAHARSSGAMVLAPSLEPVGDLLELRLVLAEPATRVLRVRTERVEPDELAVRAMVMLRDITQSLETGPRGGGPEPAVTPGALATRPRSAGRATLAANATGFGALMGYSIQRASGSNDPRLLYPLLAVGAGVGLGGSIIVAEEWDVTTADAWFLSAGAWWPTASAHLLYEGRLSRGSARDDERWIFGLAAGTAGLTLATLGLTRGHVSEGGALLAHSGGALGLAFGALAQMAVEGSTDETPFAGMGYGAGAGWLVASAVAAQMDVSAGRVLAVDLGLLLGGLGGAALASPLVFDRPSDGEQRAWVSVTGGAALAGGALALLLTSGDDEAPASSNAAPEGSRLRLPLPTIGVLGESAVDGRRAPIVGLSFHGMLQ